MLIAFPRQKWLHERALLLRHKDTACLVKNIMALFAESNSLRLLFRNLTCILYFVLRDCY
jgi:hypothetical protein